MKLTRWYHLHVHCPILHAVENRFGFYSSEAKILRHIECSIHRWHDHLWYMELSRRIAKSWFQCCRRGIDFGDMPFKDFVKYHCRDCEKHQWYRFFVSYEEIDRELDCLYEMAAYE